MEAKLNNFKEMLRSCNLKVTPQRLAIFKVGLNTKSHPDVEYIFNEVKKELPEISIATVYSTLKSLQSSGFVQEIGSFGGIRRFDCDVTPHPHLVCVSCNKIEDLDYINKESLGEFEMEISKVTDYELVNSSLSFFGYCPDCKDNKNKPLDKLGTGGT